jgi:hypothetical protein
MWCMRPLSYHCISLKYSIQYFESSLRLQRNQPQMEAGLQPDRRTLCI